MKQYNNADRIMLVGKAWEIRHQLRKLAKPQPAAAVRQEQRRETDSIHRRGLLAEYLHKPVR